MRPGACPKVEHLKGFTWKHETRLEKLDRDKYCFIMLSAIMLSAIMLNAIMLNSIMLSVIMLVLLC